MLCTCLSRAMYICVYFFFFKQKTAYEMRISDWSSDVCSSDLRGLADGRYRSGWSRPSANPLYVGAPLCQGAAQGDEIVGPARQQGEQDQPEIGRASCRERVCQYV